MVVAAARFFFLPTLLGRLVLAFRTFWKGYLLAVRSKSTVRTRRTTDHVTYTYTLSHTHITHLFTHKSSSSSSSSSLLLELFQSPLYPSGVKTVSLFSSFSSSQQQQHREGKVYFQHHRGHQWQSIPDRPASWNTTVKCRWPVNPHSSFRKSKRFFSVKFNSRVELIFWITWNLLLF